MIKRILGPVVGLTLLSALGAHAEPPRIDSQPACDIARMNFVVRYEPRGLFPLPRVAALPCDCKDVTS